MRDSNKQYANLVFISLLFASVVVFMVKMVEVVIEPSYDNISFHGPFTKPQSIILHVKNPNDQSVIFKVKRTNTRRFKVCPTTGFINANNGKVVIELSCEKFDDRKGLSKRDRFTILIAHAPSGFVRASSAWKKKPRPEEIKKATRIHLPVTYVPEEPQSSTESVESSNDEQIKEESSVPELDSDEGASDVPYERFGTDSTQYLMESFETSDE